MTCEDAELALAEMPETLSPEVAEHLKTCESCRQTAQVLSLATLPEPSSLERSMLAQLPVKTQVAWRDQESRRFSVQRFAGYALAAGLGALIASGGWFSARQPAVSAPVVVASVVQQSAPVAAAESDWDTGDETVSPDDESAFFDVSWPSLTEGEEQ